MKTLVLAIVAAATLGLASSAQAGGYGHSYGYSNYGYNTYSYDYYRPTYRTYYYNSYRPSYGYSYNYGY